MADRQPRTALMGSRQGVGGMGLPVDGADTELCFTRSERASGHVRLGVPSNLPAELSSFVGRADDLERGAVFTWPAKPGAGQAAAPVHRVAP